MRKKYPSDVSRSQFNKIKNMFEKARKKTRPRETDLYDVFCAVLYVLKSGCQWRMLPSDFPKWNNVYAYFQIWSARNEDGTSILEAVLKKNVLARSVQTMVGTLKQVFVLLMRKV